jgi:hypothetical protein
MTGKKQAQKFGALSDLDDDDDFAEESLFETPLDKVEPYALFRDALLGLQQQQPQLYDSLTGSLSAEEKTVVQGVVTQAGVIAQQRAVEEAQAAAAAAANGGAA